jgi:hypothetical protein
LPYYVVLGHLVDSWRQVVRVVTAAVVSTSAVAASATVLVASAAGDPFVATVGTGAATLAVVVRVAVLLVCS